MLTLAELNEMFQEPKETVTLTRLLTVFQKIQKTDISASVSCYNLSILTF